MTLRLWVDDEREAPEGWRWAKTSAIAITILTNSRNGAADHLTPLLEVSLDHDLGGDDTGMKVLDWMIEQGVWPKVLTIHTANPPARERMLRAANAEAPPWTDIYWWKR